MTPVRQRAIATPAAGLLLRAANAAESREDSSATAEALPGYTADMQDRRFETMDALKGKDYGKSRFKYVLIIPFESIWGSMKFAHCYAIITPCLSYHSFPYSG